MSILQPCPTRGGDLGPMFWISPPQWPQLSGWVQSPATEKLRTISDLQLHFTAALEAQQLDQLVIACFIQYLPVNYLIQLYWAEAMTEWRNLATRKRRPSCCCPVYCKPANVVRDFILVSFSKASSVKTNKCKSAIHVNDQVVAAKLVCCSCPQCSL